jgi:amino acid transporter
MERLEVKEGRVGVKDIVTRKVGVFGVVGMFYAMCCAGAFGVEEMIPEVGPGMTIAILVILPFVWALPYSYIVAELGSARPVEGGNIVWVKEALGEFWFGVMVFVNFIWGLVANTVYVVLAVDYLGMQFLQWGIELNIYQVYAIKVGLIAIFFVINVLGIKEVSFTSTALSLAVLCAFILVAVFGFANMDANPFVPFMSTEYGGNWFMTIGAGLAIGIWMYSGFDEISLVAGEIKNSARIIPRALMIVIPLMVLTYVLPTIAGLGSVGDWESWTTESGGIGYHTVLTQFAPPAFAVIFVIVAVIGQCSIFNMCVAVAARASLIMSDENFGPKWLAKLTKKKGSPWLSLIVVVVVTTILLGTPWDPIEFKFLVVVDVFFSIIVCALTVAAAIVLKRSIPDEEYSFRIPGGIKMHNLFCGLVIFFCIATILLNGTDYFLGGLIVMMIIPLIYVIAKKIWKGLSATDPGSYPIDKRTGLAFGDLVRMGGYYIGFGIFSLLARLFLPWYEGDWGPSQVLSEADLLDWTELGSVAEVQEEYGDSVHQLSSGEWYLNGYYEDEYGQTIFGSFDGMLQLILVLGAVCVGIGLILYFAGRKLKSADKIAA